MAARPSDTSVLEAAAASVAPGPAGAERLRLVLCSALMLSTELALIRWAASYVFYVAYFTNLVLLASFLGIGVGFLRAGSRPPLFPKAPLLLAAFVGLVLVLRVQVVGGTGRAVTGWLGAPALPAAVMLPLVFAGSALVMAAIADGVARTFARLRPLEAYRLDIAGSLLGIAAFAGVSLVSAPPVVWGVLIGALLLAVGGPDRTRVWLAGTVALVALFGLASFVPGEHWSPYYRVTVVPRPDGVVGIRVNGLPHQAILPLDLVADRQPFYLWPYRHLTGNALGDVLVVGSGSGNDVAVALSMGARHVDAIEIDPVIRDVGRDENPDRPYQDPRVTSYVDDGRAFLHGTSATYDLIVFALPDSLTLVSGQSSLRLESYLFTLEAFREVREHLVPGGAFTMYNYYRPDVFDRFAQTLTGAFGHAPCIDRASATAGPRSQAVLTIGRAPGDVSCDAVWSPSTGPKPQIATDDRPFPYLRSRSIPPFYLAALALILLGSAAAVWRFGTSVRVVRQHLDLFFMGAAFLLLETKNVVQFALLFGTTWFVNALVFAGVLLAVLAAVLAAPLVRSVRPSWIYALLGASLILAWAVPQEALLGLATTARFAAAVALAFAPIFLANLVFAQRFAETESSAPAFGTNLLGAMVGGVLEYGALVLGYRNLLIVVLALYALAFATTPIRRAPRAA